MKYSQRYIIMPSSEGEIFSESLYADQIKFAQCGIAWFMHHHTSYTDERHWLINCNEEQMTYLTLLGAKFMS